MVEAQNQSQVVYGKFRDDKPAQDGHTAELVSSFTEPKFYDDLSAVYRHEETDTILKLFRSMVAKNPEADYLGTRDESQEGAPYVWKSRAEIKRLSEELARGIKHLNLAEEVEGDDGNYKFIGIKSLNRWEWLVAYLANMHYSIVTMGFYDSLGPQAEAYMVNETLVQSIFVSISFFDKLIKQKNDGNMEPLRNVITFEDYTEDQKKAAQDAGLQLYSMNEVMEIGRQHADLEFEEPTPDMVYGLSYTSGTTGDPKGVKSTHEGLLSTVKSLRNVFDVDEEDVFISYLPYTHVFEQSMAILSFSSGARVGYYQGNPATLMNDLAELKPTFFPSVPRIWNRIYSTIKRQFDSAEGCKGWIARNALDSKLHGLRTQASYTSGCYDSLVFNKAKQIIGGRVRYMITASAPIDTAVLEFLKVVFGAPILEAYGLTESGGASTGTRVNDNVSGHVGGPGASTKLRLRDVPDMNYFSTDKPYPRGEVCIKSGGIFKGYYKKKEKTEEAFDADGWFLTGDVGVIMPNGCLKIVDRAKNIFKLSQGEYIAPEKLENIYVQSSLIGQIFVYGDSLKDCCVAICAFDNDAAKKWAEQNNLSPDDLEALETNANFKKAVMDQITQLSNANNFSSIERPKKIRLMKQPFRIEDDILTPTFKLKRAKAKVFFQAEIDKLYEEFYADIAAREKKAQQ